MAGVYRESEKGDMELHVEGGATRSRVGELGV